ncbi:MAG: anti-sigma factor [Candidatus Nanopelagicales bacterium]
MSSTPRDLHLDPELLALLALGERAGTPEEVAATEQHLQACAICSSELDELSAVVRTARTVTPDDALVEPPDSVWAAVAAEVAHDAAPADEVAAVRRRRRPGWVLVAAAACVGLVVGAGAVYGVVSDGDGGGSPTVLASAPLEPLTSQGARGVAQVVQTPSGPRVDVDVSGLAKADGFYEVWLLDKDASKLISLGVLDSSDHGEFAMPPGISMSDYPVVDVSLEPDDGDPAHSKNSLVRGVLPA